MRAELLQRAADLARQEEPFVLAVVVSRWPASSAQPGNMALITADGGFEGWLGGSCTQLTVVREAQRALGDGRPRLVVLTPDPEAERRPGVDVFPMTCHSGGSVEIYLQPVLPAPRLAVFGDSPTSKALMTLGEALGYSVKPGAGAGGSVFAVVATLGEGDEDAIRAALALQPAYLGVVASAKRFAQMREALLALGVSAEDLDTIRCPAGLKIGARTPEEIALSILAEIVERRRSAPADELPAQAAEPAALTAVDPICGMTVEVATARHTAEHGGRTWYFCCGGCRGKFLAEPQRYAAGGSA